MKRTLTCILILCLLAGLTGCSTRPAIDYSGAVERKAAPVKLESIDFDDYDSNHQLRQENEVTEAFSNGLEQFSFESASKVLSGQEGSVCYSPISLYFALALCTTGAEGQTGEELLALLHAENSETLAEQCSRLYRLNYTDNQISKLKIANSLWLEKEQEFREDFLQTASQRFYASIYTADFRDERTGSAMGEWVSNNTNGMLSPQFSVDPEQIMAVLNTVYFYDEWIDPFQENRTENGTFYKADGGTETCDFMHQTFGSHSFSLGKNFTRSSLGMKNAGGMTFVLPDEGVDVRSLVETPEALREALTGGEGSNGEVIWSIPKFALGTSIQLKETLKDLGVSRAFTQEAEFAKITDGTAFLSNVVQETRISINEKGVEASAFTKIDYAGSAQPQGRAEMILNRPFLYAVYAQTGDLLFVGICENPN